MEAKLLTKLPQEGTGKTGESLPESNSGCPTVSGGGIISQSSDRETNDDMSRPAAVNTGNKVLVQQAFHPGLFFTRPRSASLGSGMPQTSDKDKTHVDVIMSSDSNNTPCPPPWQRVLTNRNKKRKLSSSPPADVSQLETSNSFAGLPVDQTDDTDKTMKPSKPPPIVLYGIEDLNKLTELLETIAEKNQFTYKTVNKTQLRINTANIDVYKKVVTIVRDNGLIGYTFNRKDNRCFRIVIRNLHHTTPVNAIKEDIEATGNIITGEIINARYGPEKKPTSTFFVNLEAGPKNKAIKELKYIYHQSVMWHRGVP